MKEINDPLFDPTKPDGGRPLTLDALAERWECSKRHVLDLCVQGKLRHFRVGRLYRVPVDAVLEFEVGTYGVAARSDLPVAPADEILGAEHRLASEKMKKTEAEIAKAMEREADSIAIRRARQLVKELTRTQKYQQHGKAENRLMEGLMLPPPSNEEANS